MDNKLNTYGFGNSASSVTDVVVRNRVLRNTYWLLAISMIPTVLARGSAWQAASAS